MEWGVSFDVTGRPPADIPPLYGTIDGSGGLKGFRPSTEGGKKKVERGVKDNSSPLTLPTANLDTRN